MCYDLRKSTVAPNPTLLKDLVKTKIVPYQLQWVRVLAWGLWLWWLWFLVTDRKMSSFPLPFRKDLLFPLLVLLLFLLFPPWVCIDQMI